MSWSPQQDEALMAVRRWLTDPSQQLFRMFGYAGTGKTTLAKHLAEGVEGEVLFGAYTGKAASVLRSKGCAGASTIHSMIYNTKDKGQSRLKEMEQQLARLLQEVRAELTIHYQNDDPTWAAKQIELALTENRAVKRIQNMIEDERKNLSQPSFSLNHESIVREAKLVVIDECSMVDGRMGEDLLSFGSKVLVLGDPAQLPPVMGGGFFTENANPDMMLTEIHRQAADNPIIAMATSVREGRNLAYGAYGNSQVVARPGSERVMQADQMLVGKNATRRSSNARARQLLNRAGPEWWQPIQGDKLVCLRNNHDLGLLNGTLWACNEAGMTGDDRIALTVEAEDGGLPMTVEAHVHHFQGTDEKMPWWERKEAEEFDYGYALTTHKAQGSQWADVVVFDESYCFRNDRQRWLYTAITRAAEQVTIVRPD